MSSPEADKADVKAAYDAYNALSAEHKAMVPEHIVTFLNRAYDKLFDEPGSSAPSNPSTPSETPGRPKTGVASAVPFVLLLARPPPPQWQFPAAAKSKPAVTAQGRKGPALPPLDDGKDGVSCEKS